MSPRGSEESVLMGSKEDFVNLTCVLISNKVKSKPNRKVTRNCPTDRRVFRKLGTINILQNIKVMKR